MSSSDSTSDVSTNSAGALYVGDVGDLALDTRRALIQLLAGPSLEARRHSHLWPILLRDEALIRSRLAELFLDLVLDRDTQVAFTRQADAGDLEVPVLLRRAPLTFIDSVLLLFLRQRLSQADVHAERAVIATDEIIDYLTTYERAANTDRAGFVKRVNASIEKIKKHSILQKIRAAEDRFEISPTLKLLFSVEEIQALARVYKDIAEEGAAQTSPDSERDEGRRMTSLPSEPTVPMFAQEQFRMRKLQVFNWGTFSGVHDIPISERGFPLRRPFRFWQVHSPGCVFRFARPAPVDRLQRRRPRDGAQRP